jgi:hypothetical protein
VLPEPKLTVLGAATGVRLDEATDDRGNSLIPAASRPIGMNSGAATRWQLNVPLQIPAKDSGSQIVRLRGSFDVLLQTRNQTVEFVDLPTARNITNHAGPMEVTLVELRQRGERYELMLSVPTSKTAPIDRDQLRQSVDTDLKLLDENGIAFAPAGSSISTRGERVDLIVRFRTPPRRDDAPILGQPMRAIWNLPAAAKTVAVPFEFKEVPIP